MSKKDIRANGIINFWDFPELYVYINDDFKTKILEEFSKIFKTISQSAEFLDKSNTTIRNLKKIAYRIKINHLIKISEKINKKSQKAVAEKKTQKQDPFSQLSSLQKKKDGKKSKIFQSRIQLRGMPASLYSWKNNAPRNSCK